MPKYVASIGFTCQVCTRDLKEVNELMLVVDGLTWHPDQPDTERQGHAAIRLLQQTGYSYRLDEHGPDGRGTQIVVTARTKRPRIIAQIVSAHQEDSKALLAGVARRSC